MEDTLVYAQIESLPEAQQQLVADFVAFLLPKYVNSGDIALVKELL